MVHYLFAFPERARLNRLISKNKILERASLNTKLASHFTQQIQQIVWQYKLAQQSVNIPETQTVTEIEIFTITLKEANLKHEVLRCIDQSITCPVFFELYHGDLCKMIAAYKRPSEADRSKSVISDYLKPIGFLKKHCACACPWPSIWNRYTLIS